MPVTIERYVLQGEGGYRGGDASSGITKPQARTLGRQLAIAQASAGHRAVPRRGLSCPGVCAQVERLVSTREYRCSSVCLRAVPARWHAAAPFLVALSCGVLQTRSDENPSGHSRSSSAYDAIGRGSLGPARPKRATDERTRRRSSTGGRGRQTGPGDQPPLPGYLSSTPSSSSREAGRDREGGRGSRCWRRPRVRPEKAPREDRLDRLARGPCDAEGVPGRDGEEGVTQAY